MSIEIEQKFRTQDHEEIRERLHVLGSHPGPVEEQVDLYLSHPSRHFAETGEALRLRRIGEDNRVTYKGPKFGGPTKTRRELETPFEAGEAGFARMIETFEALGFRRVATVRKRRTPYYVEANSRPLEVVLDEVEGLGTFVEVEAVISGNEDLAAAQAAVQELALKLGLAELEPRSYLRMKLELGGQGA